MDGLPVRIRLVGVASELLDAIGLIDHNVLDISLTKGLELKSATPFSGFAHLGEHLLKFGADPVRTRGRTNPAKRFVCLPGGFSRRASTFGTEIDEMDERVSVGADVVHQFLADLLVPLGGSVQLVRERVEEAVAYCPEQHR